MNFLAHLYLSGKNEEVALGNFIADAIKGSHYKQFPDGIARGILLHRQIDYFTDSHPVFRRSKGRLAPKYGIFSGIIVDLYYDHFLARNWSHYSEEKLQDFVARSYFLLLRKYQFLPARSKRILPFMISQNWLAGYADFDRLQMVFNGMSRRTNHLSGMENAITDLKSGYALYENDFRDFFPAIVSHIDGFRRNLLSDQSSYKP